MDSEAADTLRAEIERVRASPLLGDVSGRLRELFDYLARRSLQGETASQAEIATDIFAATADSASDDGTVRVYVHRLRKRLEEDRARQPGHPGLTIPPGAYRLELAGGPPLGEREPTLPVPGIRRSPLVVGALLLLFAGAVAGHLWWRDGGRTSAPPVNAMWQPFVASDRPLMLVVGDYYMFGEIDPMRPEEGRLIRDFQVDSEVDLERAREADPDRYAQAEDVGLNYLPFSAAYALRALMPVLAQHARPVSVMPASDFDAAMLRYYDVIYVGLVSGLGFLEDVNFMGSSFAVGESYDELVDGGSGKTFVSGEARSVTSSLYYKDYGYVSVFEEPGGAKIAIVAGARDTGLRGLSPLLAGDALPAKLEALARRQPGEGYEALFEFTGQQRESLNSRLVVARARP